MLLIRKPAPLLLLTGALALWLALGTALHSATDPGAAPESFIFDDAILFQKADKDKLSQALTETATKIGVSVYVAGYSFLEGEAARERATALCSRWLEGKPGLVIVYTRGGAQPAVTPSPELWRRYPTDEVVMLMQDSAGLLGDAFLSPEQRVIRATNLALEKLQKMETARLSRLTHFSPSDIRLAEILGAMLLVLAAIFCLAVWMRRRRVAACGGPYYFPDAVIGPRLGAPFSGGAVGEAGPAQKS